MSQFKAITRANREMQLDSWTPVNFDFATLMKIIRDATERGENLEDFETGDSFSTTKYYLEAWCRAHSKGGFAIKQDDGCLIFLFKLSSEAVRFKLTWGGK